MSDNPVQIDFNGIGEPEPGFAKFQEQTKITVNAPRTDKQKLDSALKRVGELTNELEQVTKERDDYKKVAMDHKEISTCVNEYRYMKANKHLFNKEQQSATYEQIVDKLLKCVKE